MNRCWTIILLVALISSVLAYDNGFGNLNNLGERISANVVRDLAPLQNLGSRINAEVQNSLKPLRSPGFPFNTNNDRQFYQPQFPDLGAQISSSVQASLAPLNNLGAQIQQTVQQSLEPVRAMEIMNAMKGGIGGVTVATHSPSGKQFIFQDGKAYRCEGVITPSNTCNGKLVEFVPKNDTDYCFIKNNFSIVNDYICIGATSVQIINGNIQCKNINNSPVLIMKKNQFEKMCKNLSRQVEYKYIANPNNPQHIKIPSDNKYVHCPNNEPNTCVFTESNSLPASGNVFSSQNSFSSNIIVN